MQIPGRPLLNALSGSRNQRSSGPVGGKLFIALCLLVVSLSYTVLAAASEDNQAAARERVEPEGFLYGLGLSVKTEIYKDYGERVTLLPILGYRGEKLSIFGPFVRYAMVQSGDVTFLIQAKPRFEGYDDSDGEIFEGMDERKSSLDVGFGVNYARDDWKLELSTLHDVLDRSNGTELGAGLSKVFRSGSFFIEPSIGLSYLESRYVDYYYGVKNSEVTSFRPRYEGDSAVNKTLGVTVTTPAFFDGLTRLGIKHTWYDSEISDSPLTDEDTSLSLLFTYSRFF